AGDGRVQASRATQFAAQRGRRRLAVRTGDRDDAGAIAPATLAQGLRKQFDFACDFQAALTCGLNHGLTRIETGTQYYDLDIVEQRFHERTTVQLRIRRDLPELLESGWQRARVGDTQACSDPRQPASGGEATFSEPEHKAMSVRVQNTSRSEAIRKTLALP